MENDQPCSYCGRESSFSCPTCFKVRYCTYICQSQDEKSHEKNCLPYLIHSDQKYGRMLIASKDISEGEIIFRDTPAAIATDTSPKPCCVGCFKRMPGMLQHYCSKCKWPLCAPKCETGIHARECELLSLHPQRFEIADYSKECSMLNPIMCLRLLWLKKNQPELWKKIDMLMDHREADLEPSQTKKEIVDFIRVRCKLTQFTELTILHILGVVDTNAYIIGENPNKDVDIQGLFPLTSILNHGCLHNTICYAVDDYGFICRATTDIKKGQQLTTNYLHYHYHFFGTSYRRPDLTSFWHFRCACVRCEDPTELKSNVDALKCQACKHGLLLPLSMKKDDEEWICDSCFSGVEAKEVRSILDKWWEKIENLPKEDMNSLETLHFELRQIFHTQHYYILEVKRRLIECIGKKDMEQLPKAYLEKKIKYCQEHLAVQKLLSPGLSEYRAYMSWNIAEPMYYLAKKELKDGTNTSYETLTRTMEVVAEHLLKVIDIWGRYRTRSSEQIIAKEAIDFLELLDEKYLLNQYMKKLNI